MVLSFGLAALGGVGCGSGRADPDCVPPICGHTYECTTLDDHGQPSGTPFAVTLHVNSSGFCTSVDNDSEYAVAYMCDSGVETYEGNVVSNWTETPAGYDLYTSGSGGGCNRCVRQ